MNIRFNKVTIIVATIINVLHGVSAPPHTFEIEQIDGSKLLVKMHGHEYYNWVETIDGYVIQQNYDKSWYYSKLNDDMAEEAKTVFLFATRLFIEMYDAMSFDK